MSSLTICLFGYVMFCLVARLRSRCASLAYWCVFASYMFYMQLLYLLVRLHILCADVLHSGALNPIFSSLQPPFLDMFNFSWFLVMFTNTKP